MLFHVCRINGNDTCADLLLEVHGSSIVNLADKRGRIPVHGAAYNNHLESLQVG